MDSVPPALVVSPPASSRLVSRCSVDSRASWASLNAAGELSRSSRSRVSWLIAPTASIHSSLLPYARRVSPESAAR